jgi:hypothetical protein
MKVIFLDIDGVLNTEVFIRAFHGIVDIVKTEHPDNEVLSRSSVYDSYGNHFDPMAVDMLEWIVASTECKIVISSTWRLSGLVVMKELWATRSLPGEVIDITPSHYHSTGTSMQRGKEIDEWLEAHPEVTGYVIIDDDKDMEPHQMENFVQTDAQYGLTPSLAARCINILNRDE